MLIDKWQRKDEGSVQFEITWSPQGGHIQHVIDWEPEKKIRDEPIV